MSNWYTQMQKEAGKLQDFRKGLMRAAPAAALVWPAAAMYGLHNRHHAPQPSPAPMVQPANAATTKPVERRPQSPAKPPAKPSTQQSSPQPASSHAPLDSLRNHLRFDENEVNHVYPDPIHDKGADPNDPASWKVPTIGIGHAVDRRKDKAHIDAVLMGVLKNNPKVYQDVMAKHRNLSEDELHALLEKDVARTEGGVTDICKAFGIDYTSLSPTVKEVFLNMGFQMGAHMDHHPKAKQHGLAAFQTFLKAVKEQRWGDAIKSMLSSTWGRTQTPQRAFRLANLIAREFRIKMPPAPKHYHDYPNKP